MLLILLTAFLDLLGFSILMPVLPDITEHFHQAESWTMWTQSVYAVGMFFAGFIIGNLSDKYGRKNMLIFTTSINLLGYIVTLIALQFWNTVGIVGFVGYLFARLIAWVGGAGFGVVQAYISDISSPEEKTKNMGLMGAAFGTAFLVGPAIGGLLASFSGIEGILIVSSIIITINLIWIIFGLPEPKHHIEEMPTVDITQWQMSREVYILLFLSMCITIGFSVMQSGSGQYYTDRFGFDADMRGYTMAVVGAISIIFQGFLVKYVRKVFDEYRMFDIGLFLVALGMILLALNPFAFLVFFVVILFPLGMGSLGPSLASLLARDAGKHAGRVMGINTSMTWVGGIIGPILTGGLYAIDITLPFYAAGGLFLVLLVISFLSLKQR
jgi:DHA1 family tetracycline resistance protein-like MFS transporter